MAGRDAPRVTIRLAPEDHAELQAAWKATGEPGAFSSWIVRAALQAVRSGRGGRVGARSSSQAAAPAASSPSREGRSSAAGRRSVVPEVLEQVVARRLTARHGARPGMLVAARQVIAKGRVKVDGEVCRVAGRVVDPSSVTV